MADVQALNAMDDASAALILELQQQDMEEILSNSKGKGREGDLSDAEIAFATYRDDLRLARSIIADRHMSRSLTRAVILDANVLNELAADEQNAADDRVAAQRLAEGNDESPALRVGCETSKVEDSLAARLWEMYISPSNKTSSPALAELSDDDDEEKCVDGSSSWAASGQARMARNTYRCVSCDDTKPLWALLGTPCGHYYCEDCLRTLFRLAATDETLYPPRCCRQRIPLTSARLYLDSDFTKHFLKKSVEFNTSNRTYCHRPSCSSFIPPSRIEGERGRCLDCNESTCTICKNRSHAGDCPEDTNTQQVLEMASQEGWQRCYKCRRLVELNHGCNHMR